MGRRNTVSNDPVPPKTTGALESNSIADGVAMVLGSRATKDPLVEGVGIAEVDGQHIRDGLRQFIESVLHSSPLISNTSCGRSIMMYLTLLLPMMCYGCMLYCAEKGAGSPRRRTR